MRDPYTFPTMAKDVLKTRTSPAAPEKRPPADLDYPLLVHMDGLMEALRGHVPKALKQFEPDSIHQARVATRRLKSALDLLGPVTGRRTRRAFGRILRDLRRRLGPLRDADVMLGHVGTLAKAARHRPAAAWLSDRLVRQRDALRAASREDAPPARVLAKLGRFWQYREEAAAAGDRVDALLAESLHLQLDAFAAQADRLTAARRARRAPVAADVVAEVPVQLSAAPVAPADPSAVDGEPSGLVATPVPAASNGTPRPEATGDAVADVPDPHELRIAGKVLRYTLEMAAAQGHKVPKSAARLFKSLQEHLGVWHDLVVLSDHALRGSVDGMLAHHHPHLHDRVLDLSRQIVRKSTQQLDGFTRQWSEEGTNLARAIRAAFPLPASPPVATTEEATRSEASIGRTASPCEQVAAPH